MGGFQSEVHDYKVLAAKLQQLDPSSSHPTGRTGSRYPPIHNL